MLVKEQNNIAPCLLNWYTLKIAYKYKQQLKGNVSKEMVTGFTEDYDDYLFGVPLAILTRFFNKDTCIKNKGD